MSSDKQSNDNVKNNSDDNTNAQFITVYIDGQPVKVDPNDNLLAGVLSAKLNLPYFCWHPEMGSVGACRQCAVTQFQDENDERGRIVMACTTPVSDGMRIGLNNQASSEFREQVIAAMMTNHPHDCPVCAEGGECHLQDMTVMTGHSARHFPGLKRTFTNQNLGQFVGHEMNRCITCYRCVRYYNDYAGGTDFGVYGSKNQVYFGRQQEGQLQSQFSGNLVEVCPTGVFTNKVFSAHYSRKWDLQSAPSVCGQCATGCNVSIGERYGSVRRVMNRYNPDINRYFICDHGRFGIEFVNSEQRITACKGIEQRSPVSLSEFDVVRAFLPYRGKTIAGIASASASLEANSLLKVIVGQENFSCGFTKAQQEMAILHRNYLADHPTVSNAEIEQSDYVLIIQEDVAHSAPRIALSVRQASRNKGVEQAASLGVPKWQDSAVRTIAGDDKSPITILSAHCTDLDDCASDLVRQTPSQSNALIDDIIALINAQAEINEHILSGKILAALLKAKQPLIVCGWDSEKPELLQSATKLIELVAKSNSGVRSVIVPPEANSLGLAALVDEQTLTVEDIESKSATGQITGLILLESQGSELSTSTVEIFQHPDRFLCAIAHLSEELHQECQFVLPATTYAESDGHFVNYQGRVQGFYQALAPSRPVQESWRWLQLIAQGVLIDSKQLDKFDTLKALHKVLADKDAVWRQIADSNLNESVENIPREPHRASGRTAKMANQSVHEVQTTKSQDEFNFSMEGENLSSSSEMPYTWAPGWNSNQSIHHFQECVNGALVHSKLPLSIDWASLTKLSSSLSESALTASENDSGFIAVIKPWYLRLQLTQPIPEFRLLTASNVIYCNPVDARKNEWQQGTWLKIEWRAANNDQHFSCLAQVMIDSEQTDQLYGLLPIEPHFHSGNPSHISPATDAQIQAELKRLKQKKQIAEQEKLARIARLKERDQMIPIRLVSGGLDDA